MYAGKYFFDDQVRVRVFTQITAILSYGADSLMLAGEIPETPPGGELVSFFVKTGYEIHIHSPFQWSWVRDSCNSFYLPEHGLYVL